MQYIGSLAKMKWQMKFILEITKKDVRIYYLKPPVLIFGIFFPCCLFYAFAVGRNIEPSLLLPGMLGMTLFFLSSSTTPIITPWETMSKTLERLVSTPASVTTIITGDIIAGFLYGVIVSLIPLSIGLIVLGMKILNIPVLILDIVLSAFCFAILGSLLSTPPTQTPAHIMLLSNLIRLPLIFVSGVFIPIEAMPNWEKAISIFSPLTYTCDLARHALLNQGHFSISTSLLILSIYAVGFFFISVYLHRKSIPKRLV